VLVQRVDLVLRAFAARLVLPELRAVEALPVLLRFALALPGLQVAEVLLIPPVRLVSLLLELLELLHSRQVRLKPLPPPTLAQQKPVHHSLVQQVLPEPEVLRLPHLLVR
jgi:hypothetical protein